MPQPAAAFAPGQLVLGRYRPLRPLGSGGAGSVWLACDERSGLDVALKIVKREGSLGPRAEREAAAAAQLRHEHCLRAYTLARDSSHVYIAYEYVPGRTFREALQQDRLGDRGVLEAAAQILDGLAHAHSRGIVHRDVKPANVLLEEGPDLHVRILDFGLALISEEDTLTAVGDIPGTLAYISPERLRGETAGPAADIWSVGVLLWEALAGRHPFTGGPLLETAKRITAGAPSLATARRDLPKAVVALVDRALSVEPAKRPSAAKLAAGLRRALSPPERRGTRRSEPASNRLLLSGSGAVATIVPAGAAALYAGWTAGALPFFPAHGAQVVALIAALVTLLSPRLGLLVALAAPVFPLGNLGLGLAAVYGIVATAWFVLTWGEARTALFPLLGPLLAPASLLGLLPLAAQGIRSPARRAFQTAGAVLAAATVAGAGEIHRLGADGASQPLVAARALWRALEAHPALGFQAAALAAAALLLPLARRRGLWPIAGFGAAMLALTLLPDGSLPALPLVGATWLTCAALAAEPALRGIRSRTGG